MNNIKSLHVIRGIAALIVVVYHAKFVLWSGGVLFLKANPLENFTDYMLFGIDMLSSCGLQCVLVFFILSGFVIHHSFNQSSKNFSHFYIVRFIRIYPPYLFSIAFSVLTLITVLSLNTQIAEGGLREYNTRLLVAFNDINLTSIIRSLFFFQAKEYPGLNFAYWSLLHEAAFYLLYPIYYFLGARKRAIVLCILLLANFFFEQSILHYQVYFLLGILLNDYYLSGKKIITSTKIKSNFYPYMIALGFVLTNLSTKVDLPILPNILCTLTTLFAFEYIIIHGIKRYRLLDKLGEISYTLYLNHLPVLLICYGFFSAQLNKVIIYERYPYYTSVIIAVLLCSGIYLFTERPTITLIKKLKLRWVV